LTIVIISSAAVLRRPGRPGKASAADRTRIGLFSRANGRGGGRHNETPSKERSRRRTQQAATEQRVGYARAMSSPSNPPTLLPAGRTKWLWLAVAGALGVWLIVLLLVAGPESPEAHPPKTPFDGLSQKPKGFDTSAAKAFSNLRRMPVKSTKRSVPLPVAPDQAKGE
jgi:hypothetical protein